jgi:hypothetical protein
MLEVEVERLKVTKILEDIRSEYLEVLEGYNISRIKVRRTGPSLSLESTYFP